MEPCQWKETLGVRAGDLPPWSETYASYHWGKTLLLWWYRLSGHGKTKQTHESETTFCGWFMHFPSSSRVHLIAPIWIIWHLRICHWLAKCGQDGFSFCLGRGGLIGSDFGFALVGFCFCCCASAVLGFVSVVVLLLCVLPCLSLCSFLLNGIFSI